MLKYSKEILLKSNFLNDTLKLKIRLANVDHVEINFIFPDDAD